MAKFHTSTSLWQDSPEIWQPDITGNFGGWYRRKFRRLISPEISEADIAGNLGGWYRRKCGGLLAWVYPSTGHSSPDFLLTPASEISGEILGISPETPFKGSKPWKKPGDKKWAFWKYHTKKIKRNPPPTLLIKGFLVKSSGFHRKIFLPLQVKFLVKNDPDRQKNHHRESPEKITAVNHRKILTVPSPENLERAIAGKSWPCYRRKILNVQSPENLERATAEKNW